MKKLRFRTTTKIYELDPVEVAENRADHYEDKGTEAWQEEVDFALSDECELRDWLFNNTDPGDFISEFVFVGAIEDSKSDIDQCQSWDDLELDE